DGAVLRRRIDARDRAVNDAVARIDLHGLARQYVFGLRFSNLQFSFQAQRIGDPCDVLADGHLLADFDLQELQDAVDAGAHFQRLDLSALEVYGLFELADAFVFSRQSRFDFFLAGFEALLFDLDAVFEIGSGNLREL